MFPQERAKEAGKEKKLHAAPHKWVAKGRDFQKRRKKTEIMLGTRVQVGGNGKSVFPGTPYLS